MRAQLTLSPQIFYVRAVPYYNDSGMRNSSTSLKRKSEEARGILLHQRDIASMGFDNHKLPCVSSVDIIAHPPTRISGEQLQHTRA